MHVWRFTGWNRNVSRWGPPRPPCNSKDGYCHLVDMAPPQLAWVGRVIEGSHLVWLEHQPLGLLIWNSTRDCLPVSHCVHLHESSGGQAGMAGADHRKVLRRLAADALAASFSESQVSTRHAKALVCAVCRGQFLTVHVDSVTRLSFPPKMWPENIFEI